MRTNAMREAAGERLKERGRQQGSLKLVLRGGRVSGAAPHLWQPVSYVKCACRMPTAACSSQPEVNT